MNSKPAGVVLWEGASLLDGAPLVVLATLHSDNVKTGDMVQTWILRADIAPHDAVRTGADASICGDCKHRGDGTGKGRSCYVTVHQGPLSVYRAWQRGNYPRFQRAAHGELFAGRAVRLGAYGDPAAVPYTVWASLVNVSGSGMWTGYTHQWRACDQRLADYVMASCDTREEAEEARAKGWRHFRVRLNGEALMEREIVCPASDEARATKPVTCSQCRACHGNAQGRRGSVAIVIHGAVSKVNAYRETRA
jgi:hypothetical protein